ncbi:glycoside hydrolase [Spirulina subsalsa FACHB-351]|uniref:Glycoside hydrolase n=1 Tax=Spirulina subsalsa FACHB-351 TaxID=234711 RepID=A0ABT3LBR6_9CYAN|nr:glycoside hydrolase [Spirulina subsalsa]MCW6038940.1 glycoside hydrolase [Spirulina subsalsa FACHB-351]
MTYAVFVPWLHMHQPPIWVGDRILGNLEKMLNSDPNSEEGWNAQWFAQAYKNPARYVQMLSQQGCTPRLMVDYSGVLLAELAKLSHSGRFDHLYVEGEPVGDVIALFRHVLEQYPEALEFAGTAYSHCYFPATPQRDHEAQIRAWRVLFADLFGEKALQQVRGFWLPEMGMLGDASEAIQLIRLLKKYHYEWLILPSSTLEKPENWATPLLENRVHELVVNAGGETERILCVVRDTDMGIRQQSGHNAEGVVNDIRYRGELFQREKISPPPLIVPTSDGENGNVMMFEYFKNSFAPLFYNTHQWPEVTFMTVSEYIDHYCSQGVTSEVQLKETGGSWIGGHDHWFAGDERKEILDQIEQLSQQVMTLRQQGKLTPEHPLEQALLLCETSCFVYWNSEFWFNQARQFLEWTKSMF